MTSTDNYQLLITKLDHFIRKYYINSLIRGSLYTVALILGLFIALNVLEYNFYFGTGVRKGMFYSFIGISVLALFTWVLVPLLHYFRLGKVISHEQAALIIGEHFVDVKDKLLNILQLKKQSGNVQLINASIEQKSEEIKLVPFRSAINLANNKRYLRYALPPLLLLLIILFAAPSIIKDSSTRLIHNNTVYERDAPFHFEVDKEKLTVVQFEDYLLTVKVDGEILPNEVFIDIDNYQYRLKKEDANLFTYQFSNVQKDTEFRVFSSGVESEDFKLGILKKPNILGFDVNLDFPAYTRRKDEKVTNIGDLVVPMGTNIDWVFNAQNTDDISIRFSGKDEKNPAKRFDNELFTYKKRAISDEAYRIFVSNSNLPNSDSINYTITVIPDLHPTISVEEFKDSTDNKLLFFVGDASDDYGLLSLSFNYRIKNDNGTQGELNTIKLEKPDARQVQYDHTWDVRQMDLKPGDELTYYFEVFDNDGVNGSKSARTNVMVYEVPTIEEYEEQASKNNDEIKDELEKSLKDSKKIKQDLKKLRDKMLQKEEMDWQTRKELEKILDNQKELEKNIDKAKENFEENIQNQQEFEEPNEDLLEKQEKIQEMFDELMNEEMKELMEKIEELMQDLEKDEALEMMNEMEFNDEEMEMELDRMLEMFKQMEVELEMERQINKLEELAKEQEELSEETEKSEDQENKDSEQENKDGEKQDGEKQDGQKQDGEKKSQEELEKKQEEINEKFDKIQEKMDEIEKKNEELERPKDLGDQDKQMEDIDKNLDDSKQQLQQKQNKKASKSQKKAAQQMKQMAQQMQSQMQSGEMEQMEEDMESLRQLLENLVGISFDQEDLMDNISKANVNTPRYVDLVQVQNKLKDDFQLVEDSLHALSKRVFQIESFVTEKVTDVKQNMGGALEDLEERKKPQANEHQHRIMKNVNDLALMLSEVMQQMQQQMSSMMAGSQMCNKPGGSGKQGSIPMDKIGNAQDQLNKQMQKMKEGLEKSGQGGSSKEFAQMAAKQAALRKALKELQKEKQQSGQGSKELQQIIDEMNKVEIDLVNKKLSNEMLKRQKDILTRLLEADRAEREKEYDNKRKSETTDQKERKMPPSLEEYIKKREAEIDMYKSVSPSLKPYYKFLVEEYFKSLKSK